MHPGGHSERLLCRQLLTGIGLSAHNSNSEKVGHQWDPLMPNTAESRCRVAHLQEAGDGCADVHLAGFQGIVRLLCSA